MTEKKAKKAKKTAEKLRQERKEAAAARLREREEAAASLRALVHKVPPEVVHGGVVRTRAWLAVDKKAAQALATKSGPSVNRCAALIKAYQDACKVDVAGLHGLLSGLDKAKTSHSGQAAKA